MKLKFIRRKTHPGPLDPKEKRRFCRINTSLLVGYEVVNEKEVPLEKKAVAKNLSKGGLSLDLPEYFPKGTVLRIKLVLPTTKEDRPIVVLVKAAWTEPSETKNIYDTGVYLVKITPQDEKELQEYISLFCQ
ncbi:MAG: PilZ domain-containing protein [Candidatus Omnitrophota bacterium]